MTERIAKPIARPIAIVAVLAVSLLASEGAHAFRCGSKIVRDGMHEQQVLKACGEPTSFRHLGYTIRAFDFRSRRGFGSYTRYPGGGFVNQEVPITEYIYNFGPRKLMRRLVFEGSLLVAIETIGYGYH